MNSVLIVDDERLAREAIAYLLKQRSDIGQVWSAADGNEAIALAQTHQPDLVFLDIQMPGKTGLEVATQLPAKSHIVFATAYDQYAVNAFDLNAIDYLLKPFEDDRFYRALDKALTKLKTKNDIDLDSVKALFSLMVDEAEHQYKSRIVVKDPGRIRLVDTEQINYIAGAGNYAEIHLLDGKMVLHRATLTSLEQQLDPRCFIRIHRSTIVRQDQIAELRTNDNGDYTVILNLGQKLTLSRRNKDKIQAIIGDDD